MTSSKNTDLCNQLNLSNASENSLENKLSKVIENIDPKLLVSSKPNKTSEELFDELKEIQEYRLKDLPEDVKKKAMNIFSEDMDNLLKILNTNSQSKK